MLINSNLPQSKSRSNDCLVCPIDKMAFAFLEFGVICNFCCFTGDLTLVNLFPIMEVLANLIQTSTVVELESEEVIKLTPMAKDNCLEDIRNDVVVPIKKPTEEENMNAEEKLERGYMQYGCQHYRRRCRIRAPCCNEVFDCRHCHNEAKNAISLDFKHRHEIPRHQVQKVICSLCNTEQDVHQDCINCGVCMGKYFCQTCKLFDDDTSKKQYHCSGCGICRIGGRDNFIHCFKCGCCHSLGCKTAHPCVERAMHHDCPVCFEYLFENILPCGHTIHMNCLKEMQQHYQYACPLCSKSVCDMSKVWEKIDMEVAATPMPEVFQNKMVSILCNDCGSSSLVQYHIVAQKCLSCNSYNTRQTRG